LSRRLEQQQWQAGIELAQPAVVAETSPFPNQPTASRKVVEVRSMATASRLLLPSPPPAAPTCRYPTLLTVPRSCRLAIPTFRCRATAAAAVDADAPLLLEERAGAVAVREFVTLDELRAAVRLRVRTFYEYSRDTVGAEVIDLFNQSHLFPAPSLCELLHFRNEPIAEEAL
jgi:hypothetical protein